MDRRVDVVVVGGGIAGSALATVLARDGYQVVVLERQTAYRDKVRGEVLCCWGVAEALRLDLEKPLLDAGGHYATRGVRYDEVTDPAQAQAAAAPLDRLLPGVPGVLNVGHPEACEALTRAAEAAGATVIRGVGDVEVTAGCAPVVRYEHDDVAHEASCRLIVGADGRMSTVRRRLGIELTQTRPRTMGGGMLVDGLDSWPADQISLGTEGDLYHLMFPRAGGRARLYLLHDIVQRGRFAGPDRQAEFLAAYGFGCIPGSEMFADARPAGPCAFYPMNDTWTDRPYAPGVVLIGDAAGWNDPIIGQGLSVALRDARIVADILRAEGPLAGPSINTEGPLAGPSINTEGPLPGPSISAEGPLAGPGSDWSVAAFAGYGQERRERMRRLRVAAQVVTDLMTTFTPAGAARRRAYDAVFRTDPVLGGPRMVSQLGPENVPAEAFEQSTVDRILALS